MEPYGTLWNPMNPCFRHIHHHQRQRHHHNQPNHNSQHLHYDHRVHHRRRHHHHRRRRRHRFVAAWAQTLADRARASCQDQRKACVLN